MRWLLCSILCALLSVVRALSTKGNRLLVVLEEVSEKDLYSKFWEDLKERGFQLSFESPRNENLALYQHGERLFDHLILFPAKSKGLGPTLTPNALLNFINSEGNILLALSANTPTPSAISSLLLELDIHLPPSRSSLVVDHFNYDLLSASEKHDVVLLPRPDALRQDVKNYFRGEGKGGEVIAFPRGVGQSLGNGSPHLAPVLRAPRTTYCYNNKDESEVLDELFAAGQQLSLITTLQARNNARFTVLGSVEMLSDEWFDAKVKRSQGERNPGKNAKEVKTSNRAFAKEVSGWTFSEIGVLKVGEIVHHLNQNETKLVVNPKIYRVNNEITYTIEISEYSWTHLIPFDPPENDAVQLEVTMLSPYHRLTLTPTSKTTNSTLFSTILTLPDQHGIFTFRVNYKRPFLSSIDEKTTVTVRHFAHDEYPRSWVISGGWVWIAGVWGTVAGWLFFVAVWLWSAPPKRLAVGKKMQ